MFIWMEWWRQIGPSGEWQYFAFSDVFLRLCGEYITLQLNEISGPLLSFDSIGKCQIKLVLRCLFKNTSILPLSLSNLKCNLWCSFLPFPFRQLYSKKMMFVNKAIPYVFSEHSKSQSCAYNYVVWGLWPYSLVRWSDKIQHDGLKHFCFS